MNEKIKLLQNWAGVPEDGIIGPQTIDALLAKAGLFEAPAERRINAAGLQILKDSEGLRLTAYRDPVGVLTIGYGSTGPHVTPGLTITEAQAENLLREDLSRFEKWVAENCSPATDNQFSALVSFAFNLGENALKDSSLRRKHMEGDYVGAASEFGKWINAGGHPLPGLVKRRAKEAQLYRSAA
jgi:lysozyme